jgi:hypothetical protein
MLIGPGDIQTLFALVVLSSVTAAGLISVIPARLLPLAAPLSACIMCGAWLWGLV